MKLSVNDRSQVERSFTLYTKFCLFSALKYYFWLLHNTIFSYKR